MAKIKQLYENNEPVYPVGYAMGGAKFDLLWSNPNPTSDFASQTISLQASDYDFAYVEFSIQSGDAYVGIMCNGIIEKNETKKFRVGTYVSTLQFLDNGMVVTKEYASLGIPQKIYGVKLAYVVPTEVHGLEYTEDE